uniref:Glycosyltransferase 2-like domain-containing protein n=1 Tax=Meloidogyne incognita TaxID=6306 RepID=A0A914KX85_MELIC
MYFIAHLFLFFSIFFTSILTNSPSELPECPFIDPSKDLNKWANLAVYPQKCNVTKEIPEEGSEERELYDKGIHRHYFNAWVSDKIGPEREIEIQAHEKCSEIDYSHVNLKTSIVIVYHNEAFSVLVRMINGLFRYTPSKLLKEIILYDDASESHSSIETQLKEYSKLKGGNWGELVKFFKTEERQGLIRAKVFASREASGDVIVFLDSHCEVTPRWLEPLLSTIQENKKRIVLPVVDLINANLFGYEKAMVAKGTFDWGLHYRWDYFDWSYFNNEENNIKPYKTPTMSGGLLAISTEYFREIGEYDVGMEIWGGENIELSLRVWLCGGEVLVAPCSRVGHVFRTRRPYKGKRGLDTSLYNALRTAKVWLGEYYEKQFLPARPSAKRIDPGDLTERFKLKEKLQCKPFDWFIENIEPDLMRRHDEL